MFHTDEDMLMKLQRRNAIWFSCIIGRVVRCSGDVVVALSGRIFFAVVALLLLLLLAKVSVCAACRARRLNRGERARTS